MTLRFARRCLAALAIALAAPASASTTYSPDFTDMWWNAQEDGWGINIVQQGDVIFATWFVYGPDGTPRWYVASGMEAKSTTSGYRFEGKLYQTTGPWFGGAYAPAATSVEAGNAVLQFSSVSSAALTYSVGTTNVTKQITRYGFRSVSPVGVYFPAGLTSVASSCANSALNGNRYDYGSMTVTQNQSQNTVTFRLDVGSNVYCEFTGTLGINGRFGAVNGGTFRCLVNNQVQNTGTFTLAMLDVQLSGMTAIFNGADTQCQISGRFGGLRDVAQ